MFRSAIILGAILSFIASISAFTPQSNTAFSQFSRQIWGGGVSSSTSHNVSSPSSRSRNTFSFSSSSSSSSSSLSAAFQNNDSIHSTSMSTVIERPGVKTGGPAILDRPTVEKNKEKAPVKENKRTGSEAWEVRIFNDGTNTREFVARCLVQITGLSEITAYQTMMQAHQNGVAVVGRYVYEIAEMYHSALKKNGIICDLVPVDEDK